MSTPPDTPPPAAEPFAPERYFDERVAARYDDGIRMSCPGYDSLHTMLVPLLQLLPTQARVLSAGAGTGAEILALAPRFPGWTFVAIDVAPAMLEVCRRRLAAAGVADGRVEYFCGRVADYPEGAHFDAATSIFVGHFIPGPAAKGRYFRSITTRLKPGAPLVVADLFGAKESAEFLELIRPWLAYYISHGTTREKLANDLDLILRDMDFMPEADILSLLRQAGLVAPLRFFQNFLFGGWIGQTPSPPPAPALPESGYPFSRVDS